MVGDSLWSKRGPYFFPKIYKRDLGEYLDDFCSAYVDDILVFTGGSLSEHENKVRLLLKKHQEADLGLEIDKCELTVVKGLVSNYSETTQLILL